VTTIDEHHLEAFKLLAVGQDQILQHGYVLCQGLFITADGQVDYMVCDRSIERPPMFFYDVLGKGNYVRWNILLDVWVAHVAAGEGRPPGQVKDMPGRREALIVNSVHLPMRAAMRLQQTYSREPGAADIDQGKVIQLDEIDVRQHGGANGIRMNRLALGPRWTEEAAVH